MAQTFLIRILGFQSDNRKSQIQNRKWLGLLTILAALAIGETIAEAQPTTMRKIGHLVITAPNSKQSPPPINWEMFLKGLRDLGYVEGHNVTFEHRYAEGKPETFSGLAANLARTNVDVIFARGPEAVRAARNATTTIPVVGIDLESYPVAFGYVVSLARPGRNITGIFLDIAELSGKQLELLKAVVPKLTHVAVLGDSTSNKSQFKAIEDASRALAVQVKTLELGGATDLEGTFKSVEKSRSIALMVLSSPLILAHRTQVAELARKHRLPAIYVHSQYVDVGGLMSYGPSLPDLFLRAATHTAKVLNGTRAGDIPVERPTKFEFVINLKAAKQIGLTIPPNVLARADKVIK
jgi:putative ABC transport system substrate-binding protein